MVTAVATFPDFTAAALWAIPSARVRLDRMLNWVEWAEAHAHITRGSHRFRGRWLAANFPLMASAMLLADRRWIREVSVCGPTRGGKTQTFGLNLLARAVSEGREILLMQANIGLAVKTLAELEEGLAADTDLRRLVNKFEGEKDCRRYPNGAVVNLAGANSKGQLRAFNAEIALLSELDAYRSRLGDEAGPAEQAMGRTDAYEETRKIVRESTASVPDGPIWQSLHAAGTLYRPFVDCPGCSTPQLLLADTHDGLTPADRDNPLAMTGAGGIRWEGTAADDAQRTARYVCPHCGESVPQARWPAWVRSARWLGASAAAVLDHARGETDEKGNSRPAPPAPELLEPAAETVRHAHISLWWNALYVPWSSLAVTARRLAEAVASGSPQAAINLRLALPYQAVDVIAGALPIELVNTRTNGVPRGVVPAGAERVTAFVDVSTKALDWAVVAWKPGAAGFVIDYGTEPVYRPDGNYKSPTPQQRQALEVEWRLALTRLAEAWAPGYLDADGQSVHINLVMVDMGYEPSTETVYRFCAERPRWAAAKGWTLSRKGERYFAPVPPAEAKRDGGVTAWRDSKGGRIVGDRWNLFTGPDGRRLVTADVSHWKVSIHNAFRLDRKPDAPQPAGSLSLYGDDPKAHEEIARHVTAEQQVEETDRFGRTFTVWKKSRDNHWLDCVVGCRVGAAVLGVATIGDDGPAPKPRRTAPAIRTAVRPATKRRAGGMFSA